MPAGVFPEQSGNIDGLTESRARWDGKHEASQPARDTLLSCDAVLNRHQLPTGYGSLPHTAPDTSKEVNAKWTSKPNQRSSKVQDMHEEGIHEMGPKIQDKHEKGLKVPDMHKIGSKVPDENEKGPKVQDVHMENLGETSGSNFQVFKSSIKNAIVFREKRINS